MRVIPETGFHFEAEEKRINTGEGDPQLCSSCLLGDVKLGITACGSNMRLVSRCLREKKRVKLVDRKVGDYAVRV